MPIDPNIALGVRGPQFESPTNALMQALQAKDMQQKQALGQMQMDAYSRDQTRKNKLFELAGGWGADTTDDQRISGLKNSGFFDEADKVEKGLIERKKADAVATKDNLEAAKKRVDIAGQAFNFVRQAPTLENAHAALDYLQSNGVFSPQQVAQYKAQTSANPGSIAQLADMAFRSALDAKEQLAKVETKNIGGQTVTQGIDPVTGKVTNLNVLQNTQSPDNAATVAATMRGQNMTDARAREANALTREANATVYDPERGVLVNKGTATARPATGPDGKPLGPKDKALTDAQAKANLFGTRMKEADRILTDLEGKYMPGAVNAKMAAGEIPGIGGMAGYAGNLMLSEAGQQAEQAQRDFVNAVLRRESGAVISPPEFSNAQKQYFPQPGDTPQVLTQKRANRALAIKGLEVEVPGGFKGAPTLTNPGNAGSVTGDFSSAIDAELARRGVKK